MSELSEAEIMAYWVRHPEVFNAWRHKVEILTAQVNELQAKLAEASRPSGEPTKCQSVGTAVSLRPRVDALKERREEIKTAVAKAIFRGHWPPDEWICEWTALNNEIEYRSSED